MSSTSSWDTTESRSWSAVARPGFQPVAVPMAYVDRDLAYAGALAEASKALLALTDPAALWPAAVVEAATLIPAVGVASLRLHDHDWDLVASHGSADGSAEPDEWALTAAVRQGWFDRAGPVDDISLELAWPMVGSDLAANRWRSLLVADVPDPVGDDPTKIVWLSLEPAAFSRYLPVAEIFASHVATAHQVLRQRAELERLAAARQRVGVAQGLLMSRHHISPAQAYEALSRESRESDLELRIIADRVISAS